MPTGPLTLLSEELNDGGNPDLLIPAYASHVKALLKLKDKKAEDQRVIDDYFATITTMAIENTKLSDSVAPETVPAALTTGTSDKVIKLDELVIQPTTFDGVKPRPRKWLDDFKDAIQANAWTDEIAVKYFSTYLTKSAYSWYKTEVRPILRQGTTFAEIVKLFNDNYVGASDYHVLSRKIEEITQKPRESVSVFIPRMRELILLLEPTLPEREQMRQIRCKLRPEYGQWIAHDEPKTIAELRACCLKVEAGLPNAGTSVKNLNQAKQYNQPRQPQRYNRTNPEQTKRQDYKKHENYGKQYVAKKESSNSERRPNVGETKDYRNYKCYECGKIGHLGKDCSIRLKRQEAERRGHNKLNMVSETKASKNEEANVLTINHQHSITTLDENNSKLNENDEAEVTCICQTYDPEKSVNFLVSDKNSYLTQKVNINKVQVTALVDTGAFYSVVSEDVVLKSNWQIDKAAPKLLGANGAPLSCKGTTQLTIELKLGRKTKAVKQHVVVVSDLSVELLLGLQILAKLGVLIDCEKQNLTFKRERFAQRLKTANPEKLPPRSISFIQAKTSETGAVLTVPRTDVHHLLIGNSIAQVEDGKVWVMVANLLQRETTLERNYFLAGLEKFELISQGYDNELVAATLEIAGTNEIVNIGNELDEDQIIDLRQLLFERQKAFSINGALGNTSIAKHSIELLPGAKPWMEPLRRRAHTQSVEANKQIQEMLDRQIIEPSNSPWASAYVLVKKKSGEFRLCVDFRRLNAQTKKSAYPLPHVDECIEQIAGNKYFSLLDFNSGFWQIEVDKESREYTAFRSEQGQFQFCRMPFGLVNAPASFQRMMNALFAGLKGVNLQAFIDDVCLASTSWPEHLNLLNKILKIVEDSGLTLKPSKCLLGAKQITFLGHEISADGIKQDRNKLAAIKAMKPPKDLNELRRFLGLCSYYRKFVRGFSLIASPLLELTKKSVNYNWGTEQQKAFRSLIKELSKDATLKKFDHKAETCVKTDASRSGVAGILLQKELPTSDWRIVACCSRRLSSSETNYSITDLEGLAIVYTLDRFRHYLIGIRFTILTDHCALCILNQKEPRSQRLHRWAITLAEFDFVVVYTKGNLHVDVDCLSRAPVALEDDKYLDKLFHIVFPVDPKLWESKYTNEQAKKLFDEASQNVNDLHIRQGIIYKKDRLYVPPDLIKQMLHLGHSAPLAGHGGVWKTKQRLAQYWWPSMKEDIESYVQCCDVCQKNKHLRLAPPGEMNSFQVQRPNELLAIDCLGKLKTTLRGNNHLIVAIDVFSRFVDAKPIVDVKAASIGEFLVEHCGRFGIPDSILTDNAAGFKNNLIDAIVKSFGLQQRWATPQHSQSNAPAERVIEDVQEKLNIIKAEMESNDDWDTMAPIVVLSQNTGYNRSIGCSPFELMFGRTHPVPSDLTREMRDEGHDAYLRTLKLKLDELRAQAMRNQLIQQTRNKAYYDKHHRQVDLDIGSLVLVKAQGRRAKLSEKFVGPYKIIGRDKDIYTLQKESDASQQILRHISDLRKYFPSSTNNNEHELPIESSNRDHNIKKNQPDFRDDNNDNNRVLHCSYNKRDYHNHNSHSKNGHPNPTKSIMVRTNSTFTKTAQVLALIGLCCNIMPVSTISLDHSFKSQNNIMLHRVDPLTFTKSDRKVVTTKGFYDLRISFRKPCMAIKEFGDYQLDGGNYQECNKLFRSELSDAFKEFPKEGFKRKDVPIIHGLSSQHQRDKRDVGTTAAVLFIYTFLETKIKSWFGVDLESARRQEERINRTEIIALATADAIKNHYQEFTNFRNQSPAGALITSLIINRLKSTAEKLRHFALPLNAGIFDLAALKNIIGTNWPRNLDNEDIELINIHTELNDNEGYINLLFTGDVLSSTTTILRARGVPHWQNLTGTPRWAEYQGPSYIVYNNANQCLKGIEVSFERKTLTRCEKVGYLDVKVKKWELKQSSINPFETPTATSIIDDIPMNTIYCFTRNITIGSETFNCPSFPFAIRSDISFKTDDYNYEPQHDNLAVDYSMNITVTTPNVTTPNWSVQDGVEAIRKVFELKNEIEEERKKQVLLRISNENELTFKSATTILSWTTLGFALGWIGLVVWNEIRHRQHRKKAKKNTKRIHEVLDELKKIHSITDEPDHAEEETPEPTLAATERPSVYQNLAKQLKEDVNDWIKPKHFGTNNKQINNM